MTDALTVETLHNRLSEILYSVGRGEPCRECAKPVLWVPYRDGREVCYDPDGERHIRTCYGVRRNREAAR